MITVFFGLVFILIGIIILQKLNSSFFLPKAPSEEGLEIKNSANTKYEKGVKLSVLNTVDGMVVTSSTYIVSGITEPDAYLEINENKLKADSHGYFQIPVALGIGRNVISVRATNKAGKSAQQDVAINRETIPLNQ